MQGCPVISFYQLNPRARALMQKKIWPAVFASEQCLTMLDKPTERKQRKSDPNILERQTTAGSHLTISV